MRGTTIFYIIPSYIESTQAHANHRLYEYNKFAFRFYETCHLSHITFEILLIKVSSADVGQVCEIETKITTSKDSKVNFNDGNKNGDTTNTPFYRDDGIFEISERDNVGKYRPYKVSSK